MFEAFKLIISFVLAIKNFLLMKKKNEIIIIKDIAIESRDQRALEHILSENDINHDVPINIGKYSGVYERPVKKKP